jgi:predicted nucleotidyltransferase
MEEQERSMTDTASTRLGISGEDLTAFCRRNQIRKLSLFGSVLRGEDRPDSDLDLLVEFEPDTRVGLLGISRVQVELSDLLGRPVDLRTAQELSRHFRDQVLHQAEVQYAAG